MRRRYASPASSAMSKDSSSSRMRLSCRAVRRLSRLARAAAWRSCWACRAVAVCGMSSARRCSRPGASAYADRPRNVSASRTVFPDLHGAGVIRGGGDVAGGARVVLAHVIRVLGGGLVLARALWSARTCAACTSCSGSGTGTGSSASWPGCGWRRRVSCGARPLPSGRLPRPRGPRWRGGCAGPASTTGLAGRACLCGSGRTPGTRCISGWPGSSRCRRASSRSRGRRAGRCPGRRPAGRGWPGTPSFSSARIA